jgi:hypothetical protein
LGLPQELPIIQSLPPVEISIKPMDRERNPVTPPNWGAQYNQLADAYLKWKSEQGERGPTASDVPPEPEPVSTQQDSALHPTIIQVLGKTC